MNAVAQGQRWITRDRHSERVIVVVYPGRFDDEMVIKRPGEPMEPISRIELEGTYEPLVDS